MHELIHLDHARARARGAAGGVARGAPEAVALAEAQALDRAQRARHAEVTRRLLARAGAPRELPDGYAFAVGADRDALELAAEFIARERIRHPALGFRLDVDAAPVAWLRVTGPAGVKRLLRAALDPG